MLRRYCVFDAEFVSNILVYVSIIKYITYIYIYTHLYIFIHTHTHSMHLLSAGGRGELNQIFKKGGLTGPQLLEGTW